MFNLWSTIPQFLGGKKKKLFKIIQVVTIVEILEEEKKLWEGRCHYPDKDKITILVILLIFPFGNLSYLSFSFFSSSSSFSPMQMLMSVWHTNTYNSYITFICKHFLSSIYISLKHNFVKGCFDLNWMAVLFLI